MSGVGLPVGEKNTGHIPGRRRTDQKMDRYARAVNKGEPYRTLAHVITVGTRGRTRVAVFD